MTTEGPKYPEISVRIQDGNAYWILAVVGRALKRAGVPADEVARFRAEATAGDYDHLLQTVMAWVDADVA